MAGGKTNPAYELDEVDNNEQKVDVGERNEIIDPVLVFLGSNKSFFYELVKFAL